ncbi:hypothetical protein G6011_02399 [Alternaria panax]|uniref:Serine hydrolase domain-containing protein n=1 Tax=Alternaria panax TaxID=48097 RepID=A0AAD4FGW9_9PLEO|nr:hypothetical protein G6011_02399 [Alternaria panax]
MPSTYSHPVSKIPPTKPDTTSLPRILCLHGGGVNAAIFKAQSRSLIRHLQHSFRLVWADGPFFCDPHSDIISVYSDYAPFRRWLRWLPEHPEIDEDTCIEEIGYAMRTAMEDDDREGGTGEWVGLMGFSQGAKLSASLLLEQQARETQARKEGTKIATGLTGVPGIRWRFGILLAGRAPLSNLNPELLKSEALEQSSPTIFEDKLAELNDPPLVFDRWKDQNSVLKRPQQRICSHGTLGEKSGALMFVGKHNKSLAKIDAELPEAMKGPHLYHGWIADLDMISFQHIVDEMRAQTGIGGVHMNCRCDIHISERPDFESCSFEDDDDFVPSQALIEMPTAEKLGLPLLIHVLEPGLPRRDRRMIANNPDTKFTEEYNCSFHSINPALWNAMASPLVVARKDQLRKFSEPSTPDQVHAIYFPRNEGRPRFVWAPVKDENKRKPADLDYGVNLSQVIPSEYLHCLMKTSTIETNSVLGHQHRALEYYGADPSSSTAKATAASI